MIGFIIAMIIFSVVNFFLVWLGTACALKGASKALVEIIEMCEAEDKEKREMFIKNFCNHEK